MSECMTFPDTVEEFMEQYKMVDTEHIYSNGTEFVPIFRMKQWFEHLSSAEPEQRWSPSSEKPLEKGSYLVWMPFALPERRITVAEYCGGYWNIKTPISAWMPLPRPYKEDEEGD